MSSLGIHGNKPIDQVGGTSNVNLSKNDRNIHQIPGDEERSQLMGGISNVDNESLPEKRIKTINKNIKQAMDKVSEKLLGGAKQRSEIVEGMKANAERLANNSKLFVRGSKQVQAPTSPLDKLTLKIMNGIENGKISPSELCDILKSPVLSDVIGKLDNSQQAKFFDLIQNTINDISGSIKDDELTILEQFVDSQKFDDLASAKADEDFGVDKKMDGTDINNSQQIDTDSVRAMTRSKKDCLKLVLSNIRNKI